MARKPACMIFFMVGLITAMLSACVQNEEHTVPKKRVMVVTTLFPLYDFTRHIGQGNVDVRLLLPPGTEAHAFEPRPSDVTAIHHADVFIFTGKFMEPWVDGILSGMDRSQVAIVDASRGVSLIRGARHQDKDDQHLQGVDPHIWLDFANAQQMAETIAGALAMKDPQNRDVYLRNAEAYKTELGKLDERYRDNLMRCRNKVIVFAGHYTFGYLANRYGLTDISALRGFTPDAEPTPKRLAGLIKRVKQYGLTHIFYEALIVPKVAEAMARETDVKLLMLHGAHNISKDEMAQGVSFIYLMDKNLENLKVGLPCP